MIERLKKRLEDVQKRQKELVDSVNEHEKQKQKLMENVFAHQGAIEEINRIIEEEMAINSPATTATTNLEIKS